MSIHHEAMAHLDKARALLSEGSDDSLRYAALEMRYCIEHLFYKIIPHYKDELPDDVMSGKIWRPGDIISMIADIDPGATRDRRLRMGFPAQEGEPAKVMYDLGPQTGLRKDLARRLWNGLGYYLHARVDGQAHNPIDLRKKLEKVLPRLEQFRGDRVIMSGFDVRTTSKCQLCGRTMARRMSAIKENPYIECPNRDCGAIYEITEADEAMAHWKMVQASIGCKRCGTENWLGVHAWKHGAQTGGTLTCCECKTTYRLVEYITLTELSEPDPTTA